MFIVVQEVPLKKSNIHGTSKRIETSQMSFNLFGDNRVKNYYDYSIDRFERPIKKAYKVSIQSNYRENGKVKKKQRVLMTVDYYMLIDDDDFLEFGLYGYIEQSSELAVNEFGMTYDKLYEMIKNKLRPIVEHVNNEFQQTEEYRVKQQHKKIINDYDIARKKFADKYNVNLDEYDYCYNVFGELTNEEYLNKIKEQHNSKSSYQEKNYSNYNSSSYLNLQQSNYTENEKDILKRFYKVLAKTFHPDLNLDKDTTEEMQLLNKLKEDCNL